MKRPDEVHAIMAQELSNEALLAEVNHRLQEGDITPGAIELPDGDLATGGGMAFSETESRVDLDALDEAQARFARKDYPEALYQLEKALGRDFLGLGDLVLERRS